MRYVSLFAREVFKNVNLSYLEFRNCLIPESLTSSGFLGSRIDVLTFNEPGEGSYGPYFKRIFDRKEIHVRKLEIKNAYSVFKKTTGQFGLDFLLLNEKMFQYLEELSVVNTYLDYIEPRSFMFLENLKIVRLENVNLKNVILFYFIELSLTQPEQEIEFTSEEVNWLANKRVERVYLGREQYSESKFAFEDEYLCYFAGLSANKLVFIYDSIDEFVINNFECTCSIYWIYSKIENFEEFLVSDYDARYVPECVRSLKNSSNIQAKLDSCLNGSNPNQFCKYSQFTTTDLSTTTITTETTTTSIKTTVEITTKVSFNSTRVISETTGENSSVFYIMISLLVITSLILVFLIGAFVFYIFKNNRGKKISDQIEIKKLRF